MPPVDDGVAVKVERVIVPWSTSCVQASRRRPRREDVNVPGVPAGLEPGIARDEDVAGPVGDHGEVDVGLLAEHHLRLVRRQRRLRARNA